MAKMPTCLFQMSMYVNEGAGPPKMVPSGPGLTT